MPTDAPADVRLALAGTPGDVAAATALFRAYAASLDVDLAYQGFEAEMAGMPGPYAPPTGALLLARGPDGEVLGAVALRALADPGTCEMKRLYVAPAGRGRGVGEALVTGLTREAERLGYREMRLDTLPTMAGARALYIKLGFAPIAPYYDSPVAGTLFMRRILRT